MTEHRSESERACLSRLQEMDDALARMEDELPEDMLPLGAEAAPTSRSWSKRCATSPA
jgi:hypothetical protein